MPESSSTSPFAIAGLRGIGVAEVVKVWHKVAFAIKGGDAPARTA